ncbi:MAG: TetR/AcrR family transcriptional regulator [Alphaproteobacteria bacterium]|nr:TetR/AcrR family transcriptional regulator [Alphaproteobacteria bacterium]MBF0130600.1 TetR/AcrR family transcriptional regulator [Alphaproteobacteria bacterium]
MTADSGDLRGKRRAILDAAAALFASEGYAGTSMDALAARANVSKATVYAHFSGKAELLGAVVRQLAGDFQSPPEGLSSLSAAEGLRLFARRFLDLILDERALSTYRLVVAEARRFPEMAETFHAVGPEVGLRTVAGYLGDLTRRGDLAVPDPELAAMLFLNMLKAGPHLPLLLGLPPGPVSPAAVIDEAVRVMLAAYAAPYCDGS